MPKNKIIATSYTHYTCYKKLDIKGPEECTIFFQMIIKLIKIILLGGMDRMQQSNEEWRLSSRTVQTQKLRKGGEASKEAIAVVHSMI